MESYIEPIKIAILVFPFIALLISVPFILIQYHKYGSNSFLRALIVYSFTLYYLCAYFLVILPLPKISEVALLTTPKVQLIPFSFIIDFINNTSFNLFDIHTYIKTLTESYFYVPMYNILLTLPFGIYLRYYFKCNLKKVILYTFLLSLFFELTQVTGLYYIYPRGYRLFDVDDLLLNTLGGIVGYLIAKPIISVLPTRDKIDEESIEKGKKVTGFKRTTSLFLDIFILLIIELIGYFLIDFKYTFLIIFILYYFIIPLLLKGSTLGQKYLNLRIVDNKDNINILRLYYRLIVLLLIYFGIPVLFYWITRMFDNDYQEFIILVGFGIIFLIYAITGIKYLFTNSLMLYEKISKTKIISTIK